MRRALPNIVITGTPGTGKTSLSELLADQSNLKAISIGQFVNENKCYECWDEEYQCWLVDDDKLFDALEVLIPSGGFILDWHNCDFFPETWVDLVVVLRTDCSQLYDRLSKRKYNEHKMQGNLDTEIMGLLLEEARTGFQEGKVVELMSNNGEDLDSNVERLREWIDVWKVKITDHSEPRNPHKTPG